MARLAMKSTGYELFGMFCMAELRPRTIAATPMAVNSVSFTRSLMTFFSVPPITLPAAMAITLTMVPIIVPLSV